jgi:hypothetical protein
MSQGITAAGFIAQKFEYAPLFFSGTFAYLLAPGILHAMDLWLKQVEVN